MTKKKSKAKSKAEIKAEIKKMEDAKRTDIPVAADKRVSFDSWYHQRNNKIPKIHRKEVLMADFESRGLKKEASMEEYDKALKLYGVEL